MLPTIARPPRIRGGLAWLCCLLVLLPTVALAQIPKQMPEQRPELRRVQPDEALARSGVEALARLDYSRTAAIYGQLEAQNPHFPLLRFLRAGILWVKAEAQQGHGDARIPAWVAASHAFEAAVQQAEAHIKDHDPDPRWQLALGMSQFFLARTYVEQHKVFKVYHYARAGRDTLRELIQHHPDMYDAYFVLGIYEYIAGSIPRGVDWLAVLFDISGDRQLGIHYLQLAIARAPLMAPEAARMLLAAAALQPQYVKNPCQYLPLARQGLKLFPQNPHFSGAYQMLSTQCGYPQMAMQENVRARAAYLKQFPDMGKILDIVRVQTLASMGDLAGVKAMRPRFAKKNTAYWYLSMGQVYDVLGKRDLARKNYYAILYSGRDGEPDVLSDSDNTDWVEDQMHLYLDKPYQRPEPSKLDPNSPYLLKP